MVANPTNRLNIIPQINLAVIQYFDRAAWALNNATNDALPPNVKSHLTAVAVHACQSLKESLDQAVAEDSNGDIQLAAAIKELPHVELIENIRNMDLHGWPLPVCDPKVRMIEMVSKPGNPMQPVGRVIDPTQSDRLALPSPRACTPFGPPRYDLPLWDAELGPE